ncbi:hypothetical protein JCM8097_007537 [Rhodosporidiobolus ruineniae]
MPPFPPLRLLGLLSQNSSTSPPSWLERLVKGLTSFDEDLDGLLTSNSFLRQALSTVLPAFGLGSTLSSSAEQVVYLELVLESKILSLLHLSAATLAAQLPPHASLLRPVLDSIPGGVPSFLETFRRDYAPLLPSFGGEAFAFARADSPAAGLLAWLEGELKRGTLAGTEKRVEHFWAAYRLVVDSVSDASGRAGEEKSGTDLLRWTILTLLLEAVGQLEGRRASPPLSPPSLPNGPVAGAPALRTTSAGTTGPPAIPFATRPRALPFSLPSTSPGGSSSFPAYSTAPAATTSHGSSSSPSSHLPRPYPRSTLQRQRQSQPHPLFRGQRGPGQPESSAAATSAGRGREQASQEAGETSNEQAGSGSKGENNVDEWAQEVRRRPKGKGKEAAEDPRRRKRDEPYSPSQSPAPPPFASASSLDAGRLGQGQAQAQSTPDPDPEGYHSPLRSPAPLRPGPSSPSSAVSAHFLRSSAPSPSLPPSTTPPPRPRTPFTFNRPTGFSPGTEAARRRDEEEERRKLRAKFEGRAEVRGAVPGGGAGGGARGGGRG